MEPPSLTRARVLRELGVLGESWSTAIRSNGRVQSFSALSAALDWMRDETRSGRVVYLSRVELCERRSMVNGALSVESFRRNVPIGVYRGDDW